MSVELSQLSDSPRRRKIYSEQAFRKAKRVAQGSYVSMTYEGPNDYCDGCVANYLIRYEFIYIVRDS
jgi:hypothetical protein